MKYDLRYKYLEAHIGKEKVVVEFGFDNMLGKDVFSAKSNLLFKDKNGDYGHAVGVGKNEKDALLMCINEIKEYTNCDIVENDFVEIDCLKRIVFEYKKKAYSLYFEQSEGAYCVFTFAGTKTIVTDDIVKYVSDNIKEVVKYCMGGNSKENSNKQNRVFDNMTKKFN